MVPSTQATEKCDLTVFNGIDVFDGSNVKRPKVLVVDDDPGMREVLESILVTENVEVCSAIDGKDAVQKTLTLNPDLILLDIGMPKLNGLTFCKAVRAGTQTRNMPIIIVTALTARGRLEECMEAGADDFVGKPFQVEDLLIRVRAMLKTADVSDHVERINEYILAVHDMHARRDSHIGERAAGGVKLRATPTVQCGAGMYGPGQ